MPILARGSAPKALSLKQLRARRAAAQASHPCMWRRDEAAADFDRHAAEALDLVAADIAPVIDITKGRKR